MDVDPVEDSEYVYDTYVRDVDLMTGIQSTSSPLQGNIGILVIREEDQELWDTYLAPSSDSDHEFETDEEDENAEGYYGADYPEDEVSSDDERDTGAYNYRKNASDDEEYDAGTFSEDDQDEGMRYPWRKKPGFAHEGDGDDD